MHSRYLTQCIFARQALIKLYLTQKLKRADSNVPGNGSINPTELGLDDPGGGTADDDPGGGSITSADADSALIVSNASKTSSSPLLSSFATGLTSSRDSSSIVAKDLVSDDSDDEDVEYKCHFCSGCALFLLLGVCVGGFVGMVVLGCGKQVLGVRAAKTTIERV